MPNVFVRVRLQDSSGKDDYVDWKSEAERLRFDEGLSWSEIAAELGKYFPNLNSRQVFEKVRSYIRRTDR